MSSTPYFRPTMKFDLDIDELIKEVHHRPAIWNKGYVGYTDRKLKARMWDEVCESLIDNWKNLKMLQQNTISNEVQKKWRNVKDTFMKEQKRIREGQYFGKKRQYIHFKALSFLSNSELYTSSSAISVNGTDDDSDNTSAEQETTNKASARKRSRKQNQYENESLTKREKFDYDYDNSNSEHNNPNTDNKDDNLLDDDFEKSEYLDLNSEFVNKKDKNRDDYSDRHFVEIKCNDWDHDSSQIVSKKVQDKFVKVPGDVKLYDEDISFTEMLVPMLRKLNDDQKHFAKIEILNILHKAKRYSAAASCETQTNAEAEHG